MTYCASRFPIAGLVLAALCLRARGRFLVERLTSGP